MDLTLDLLVIGFGKAGKTLAMKRAAAGDRVAIVEQSPAMYGGTCINIACVPTKRLLIESARGTDFPAARQDRNAFIAKLNAANKKMVEDKDVLIIDGFATFTGPKTVQVADLSVTAETIVINTGARSNVAVEGKIHDSTSIQQIESRPDTLAIIGAGPIGLEFATMFNQFGSQVTVYTGERPFLPAYDPDIAEEVQSHLAAQGITFVAERVADPNTLDDDAVLVATGRKPVIDDLGLDAAGIAYTDEGIAVDEYCQTNVEGVYAAGDVNGGPQFTYVSYDDHRVILSHRWGDRSRSRTGRVIPTTIFTNPPLSQVGMSEQEAKASHRVSIRKAKIADLAIVPRPKIEKHPEGVAKFIVDEDTDAILGATLFCVNSHELINTVALAIAHGLTAKQVGDAIYTHPATSEVFNALLASS
ncbi:FAD-dependent oxidoreductase [Trueperella pyogenes]|uniref:FAD-dependent oxidoreductase n=1 Tax=Trueperella pyogenes TaxID=1661 RepID=UPI00312B308E